jgi:hypothetical protein
LVLGKSKEYQSESRRLLEQEIQKNTLKKDIGNPYKTSYLEQRFGQPEARLYSWRGFAYKTNTIALLTCFSLSVLGETGLGAI